VSKPQEKPESTGINRVVETIGLGAAMSLVQHPVYTVLYHMELRMHLSPQEKMVDIWCAMLKGSHWREKPVYRTMCSGAVVQSIRRGGRNTIHFNGPDLLQRYADMSDEKAKQTAPLLGSAFNIVSKQTISSFIQHRQLGEKIVSNGALSGIKTFTKGALHQTWVDYGTMLFFYQSHAASVRLIRSRKAKRSDKLTPKEAITAGILTSAPTTLASSPLNFWVNIARHRPGDTHELKLSSMYRHIKSGEAVLPTLQRAFHTLMPFILLRTLYNPPGLLATFLNNAVGSVLFSTARGDVDWRALVRGAGDRVSGEAPQGPKATS